MTQNAGEGGHESPSRLVLTQVGKIGDVTQIEQLRELSPVEVEQFEAASMLVRGLAFRAPYHRLQEAKERFAETLTILNRDATESVRARQERCLDALRELFEAVANHASDWRDFVDQVAASRLGDDVEAALAAHANDPSTASAVEVCSSRHFVLELGPEGGEDLVVRDPQTGATIDLAAWQESVDRAAVIVLHGVAEVLKPDLATASHFLLGLWAEAIGGDAVIAPPMGDPSQGMQLSFTPVDASAVRAANSIVWQARVIVTQHGAGVFGAPMNSVAQPEEFEGAGTAAGVNEISAEVDTDVEAAADGTAPATESLPELAANLRQVVDAMLSNVDGLASQWAQRFPAEEFAQALEVDRAQVGSLVGVVQRAVRDESAALEEAGHAVTLPAYPPSLADVATWSSDADLSDLWAFQSSASMQAFHRYLQKLGEVGRPARLSVRNGAVETLEFSPLETAKLYANARLLIELTEDTAATAALLAAEGDHRVAAPTQYAEARLLHRAIRTSQDLGLVEAHLVYLVRLLATLDSDLDADVLAVVEAARQEIVRYLAGEPVARGVSYAFTDSLLPACAALLEALLAAPNGADDEAEPPEIEHE